MDAVVKAPAVKKMVNKELYQYCLMETYMGEVMELPEAVTIDEVTFELDWSLKRASSPIPRRLAELGVKRLTEPMSSMEASGLLTGKRKHIEASAKEICAMLKLDYRHMKVRRLTVSLGDAHATFTRMTKVMEGPAIAEREGKKVRTKVLGHVVTQGTAEASERIIKVLGAKKVNCHYSVEPVRTVTCTM